MDELPGQIAQDIQSVIDDKATDAQLKMHEAEVELERQRIKTEERINERQAERDEHIADTTAGVDELRSMFSAMLSRLDNLITSQNQPIIHTEVSTPDDNDDDDNDDDENESVIASEDIPPENPEVLGENAIEETIQPAENPVEEVNNLEQEVTDGKSRRNKRRRRR